MSRTIGSISANAFGIASQAIQNLLRGRLDANATAELTNTLHQSPLSAPGTRKPLLKFIHMLEQAAQQNKRADLGLELASLPWQVGQSIFGPAFSWAPDLRSALGIMVAHFEASQTQTVVRLFEQHGTAYLTYQVIDPSANGCLHDCVYTLGKLSHSIRRVVGPSWKPQHVAFTGSSATGTASYEKFFQAPVSFDSYFSGLCFDKGFLDQAIPTANAQLLQDFCARLQQLIPPQAAHPSLEETLKIWITQAIPKREATLEKAAQAFGMTPRTLQRQLRDANLGFQPLLAQLRLDRAKHLLAHAPDLNVSKIAEELGFSETSAFTRTFRHHMHMSPRAYRQQHSLAATPRLH